MANEFLARMTPADGSATVLGLPTGTLKNRINQLPVVGLGAGAGFPAAVTSAVMYLVRVQEAVALGTGLTVAWAVADDPLNTPVGGKVAKFGVTFTPVTSGTTPFDETAFASSTEATKSTTMASTVGKITLDSLAVVVASMNSLAAGSWVLIRFRRLGTDAADTDTGSVTLFGLELRNT